MLEVGSAIKYQLDAVPVERPAALIAAAGAYPFRNRQPRWVARARYVCSNKIGKTLKPLLEIGPKHLLRPCRRSRAVFDPALSWSLVPPKGDPGLPQYQLRRPTAHDCLLSPPRSEDARNPESERSAIGARQCSRSARTASPLCCWLMDCSFRRASQPQLLASTGGFRPGAAPSQDLQSLCGPQVRANPNNWRKPGPARMVASAFALT